MHVQVCKYLEIILKAGKGILKPTAMASCDKHYPLMPLSNRSDQFDQSLK